MLARLTGDASAPVSDRAVRNVIETMLGTARGIERIPLLIHRAYLGDYSGIQEALSPNPPATAGPPPQPAPRGVFLSLLCGESVDAIKPEQVPAATRGSFFGDAPIRSQMADCAAWPRVELPSDLLKVLVALLAFRWPGEVIRFAQDDKARSG